MQCVEALDDAVVVCPVRVIVAYTLAGYVYHLPVGHELLEFSVDDFEAIIPGCKVGVAAEVGEAFSIVLLQRHLTFRRQHERTARCNRGTRRDRFGQMFGDSVLWYAQQCRDHASIAELANCQSVHCKEHVDHRSRPPKRDHSAARYRRVSGPHLGLADVASGFAPSGTIHLR